MFIGAAPASTCAGIKVTTIAVFFLAVRAEFKGQQDITAFGKRLPVNTLRIASTILVCGVVTVVVFTLILASVTTAPISVVLFDVISAYANCGISLGLPTQAGNAALTILGILMFIGRFGTMTIVVAIMRKDKSNAVRYPSEHIILS
jgi:Trk-type K+ transport system membrane component